MKGDTRSLDYRSWNHSGKAPVSGGYGLHSEDNCTCLWQGPSQLNGVQINPLLCDIPKLQCCKRGEP